MVIIDDGNPGSKDAPDVLCGEEAASGQGASGEPGGVGQDNEEF